jgi:predicted nucleic acid-binding protein
MNLVFMDTVGLLALWNTDDQWHEAAEKAFAKIEANQTTLLTTAYVLLECGNAAARSGIRAEVDRLREQFELADTLIWPTTADWAVAWAAYRRGGADSAGIVDHISFSVMRRCGIGQVFTNDRHFRAAGFEILF